MSTLATGTVAGLFFTRPKPFLGTEDRVFPPKQVKVRVKAKQVSDRDT